MGTASGTVIAANAERTYLSVINDGTAVVYLRPGTAAAVLNEGYRLAASGGQQEFSREKGNLWTGQINGIIGVGGDSKVIYVEGEYTLAN